MNDHDEADPTSRYGTVGKLADGRSYVRFDRHLDHPVETVWAALTDPQQLARWFPGFKLERRQGGRFDMWFDGECDGPAHVSGQVTRFEPPTLLQCGGMCWELETAGDGCRLTFTDVLVFTGPRSRTDITNAVLAGWHSYMDLIEDVLAGRSVAHGKPEVDYSRVEVRRL